MGHITYVLKTDKAEYTKRVTYYEGTPEQAVEDTKDHMQYWMATICFTGEQEEFVSWKVLDEVGNEICSCDVLTVYVTGKGKLKQKVG